MNPIQLPGPTIYPINPSPYISPNPQLCKHGDNCNNNKMGRCKFLH
jgi:hypothetical protein